MSLRHTLSTLTAVGVLSLGAAACGDDEEEPATQGSGSTAAAQPTPVADIPNLTGEQTAVTLDQGFVDALTQLKVTPGPVGDAEISDEGVASFPITGGSAQYFEPGSVEPYVRGLIQHEGSGLSLEAGGKTVELEDFDVDPGRSVLTGDVSVDGQEAAPDAPLFFLDGRTLNPLEVNGSKATLEGTTVKLKKEAADLLNQTFGIDDLQEGLVIGVAEITLDVPQS